MVLAQAAQDPVIYYKETQSQDRGTRFCLKPVQLVQPRSEKKLDTINVHVVRGKTNSFIQLDEDEAKKVQVHGDAVLKKLQRIHKSIVWNFIVGRSFVDRISKSKQPTEEINLDHDENLEFDPKNPRTWSEESFEFLRSILKANEFSFDGFCILFCVENDLRDTDVDFDEVAWELEKCLIYHFLKAKSQVIMNDEATMSRRGLEPVSRKSKTPGRGIDLSQKKKQLVGSLNEAKLQPQIDERLRKSLKDIREFMPKDQLELIAKMRDIQDPKSISMLGQFISLLQNGRPGDRSSGLLGLPQFLAFLNQSQDDNPTSNGSESQRRSSSRMSSITSPRIGGAPKTTTGSILPRPSKKSSITSGASQAPSVSSRSTTPDTPRRASNYKSVGGASRRPSSHTQSSLPSIPSSGSASSTPETLRRQEHGPSMRSKGSEDPKRRSGLPKRTSTSTPSKGAPISRVGKTTGNGSRPHNGGSMSPASSTNSPRRTGPIAEGRITREDLRRMNKSYPSGPKKPGSFSRASIPLS